MDLHCEHRFSLGRADVEDAMCDPAFYGQLEIPDVTQPEILERSVTHGVIDLTLRYVFTGQLDPIVDKVLGRSEISWTQTLQIDTQTHSGSLTISPSVLTDKIDCHATLSFADTATGSTRVIDGALGVGIPLLGSKAEKAIMPGITRRLDLEAEALNAYLEAL